MTDEAYDAQTLATSARIERLHRLRFGTQARTWMCEWGHVHRDSIMSDCVFTRGVGHVVVEARFAPHYEPYVHYGKTDPEELIYSRAN